MKAIVQDRSARPRSWNGGISTSRRPGPTRCWFEFWLPPSTSVTGRSRAACPTSPARVWAAQATERRPGPGCDGRGRSRRTSVTRVRQGDEVFGWCQQLGGAFAEHASVWENALERKPAKLTFEQAAAVPTAGSVALEALRDVRAEQKVMVNGASGGIGSFAVQIAKSPGADVTGVCSTRRTWRAGWGDHALAPSSDRAVRVLAELGQQDPVDEAQQLRRWRPSRSWDRSVPTSPRAP
jgi:NADPH:quinone reductase-like Zn-dependent oxidoreductase